MIIMIARKPLIGTETVPVWHCVEGCPVKALDGQSGVTAVQKSRSHPESPTGNVGIFTVARKQKNGPEYLGDTGGASRFFKQVLPDPPHDQDIG